MTTNYGSRVAYGYDTKYFRCLTCETWWSRNTVDTPTDAPSRPVKGPQDDGTPD